MIHLPSAGGSSEQAATGLTAAGRGWDLCREVIDMTPDQIRAIRQQHNLTAEGLAEVLGVNCKTVNNWEQAIAIPVGPALILLQALRDGNATAGVAVWSVRVGNDCGDFPADSDELTHDAISRIAAAHPAVTQWDGLRFRLYCGDTRKLEFRTDDSWSYYDCSSRSLHRLDIAFAPRTVGELRQLCLRLRMPFG